MNNNELLLAISDMMDQKLDEKVLPRIDHLEERFDGLEERFNGLEERFDGLEERFDGLEERFNGLEERFDGLEERFDGLEERFDGLDDRVKNIEVTLENDVVPRLSHIEQCYVDTYERYQSGIDKLEEMQRDIDIIKITVTGHSEKPNKISKPYLLK